MQEALITEKNSTSAKSRAIDEDDGQLAITRSPIKATSSGPGFAKSANPKQSVLDSAELIVAVLVFFVATLVFVISRLL